MSSSSSTATKKDEPQALQPPPRRLQKPAQQLAATSSSNHDTEGTKPALLFKRNPATGTFSHQQRPSLPDRNPSFSKRHASFDSPREVPLPSPSILRSPSPTQNLSYFPAMGHGSDPSPSTGNPSKSRPNSLTNCYTEQAFAPVFEDNGAGWTSLSALPNRSSGSEQAHQALTKISSLSISKSTPPSSPSRLHPLPPPPPPPPSRALPASSSQILPFPRPYSLPHSTGASVTQPSLSLLDPHHHKPKPSAAPPTIDRSSSASLPLPSQIPYHTLPKVGATGASVSEDRLNLPSVLLVGDVAKSSTTEVVEESLEARPPLVTTDSDQSAKSNVTTDSQGSTSSSSGSLPSAPPSSTASPPPLPQSPLPRPHSQPGSTSPAHPDYSHLYNPPSSGTAVGSGAYPYHHTPYSSATSPAYATAIRRPMSSGSGSSGLPPPEPPTILPTMSAPPTAYTAYAPSTVSSVSTSSMSSFGRASLDTGITSPSGGSDVPYSRPQSLPHAYPQPQHQQHMRSSTSTSGSTSPQQPPYAPFLSHAPPPADSWIEVETTPSEYKLNVRLPGFKRDGITLATKRRRILHVVADSWDNGGGHFERRISFGYDADLVQVRAEFDGEILRVVVPRRAPPMFGVGY